MRAVIPLRNIFQTKHGANIVDNVGIGKALERVRQMCLKAAKGIVCNWIENTAHPGCMWIHHFFMLQALLPKLTVRTEKEINSLTFYGGTWQHYFQFGDNNDGLGKRLFWKE